MGSHFSDIHTSKESQLYGTEITVDDNESIIELKAAIADYPLDFNLHIKLGEALSYQLRYREAIEVYTKAINIEPNNIIGYRRRAGRYLTTLQLEKAYEDFKVCKTYGLTLDTEYMLGLTTFMLANYEQAKLHFENCFTLSKDNTEMLVGVIYWYTVICIRCGNFSDAKVALDLYTEDMYVGHHTAYKCALDMFLGKLSFDDAKKQADAAEGESKDLEYSMIVYALASYCYMHSDTDKYKQMLDMVLERDYFWAGFASLVAINERHPEIAKNNSTINNLSTVPANLQQYFKENKKCAIAFSGGVDSAYLLYAAKLCSSDIKAYYVNTQFQPEFELEDAKKIAKEFNINMTILDYDILSNEDVIKNPHNRCYYCKQKIFNKILTSALEDGYPLVIDGTNADDDPTDRPGMKALDELQVQSPLRMCGISKSTIRSLSKLAGLFTWNKPAYACLATRIQTDDLITNSKLSAVDNAEKVLRDMGFSDFRVRLFHGSARIQIKKQQFENAIVQYKEIYTALSPIFNDIMLDLNAR